MADPSATTTSPARRAAVLGRPIGHSLSPALHTAAYRALGLDGWNYDLIDCDEAGLPGFVDQAGPEWVGLSLTMPLKRVALTVADDVSPLAFAVGAANTLLLGPPRCRAENTDVAGIVSALGEAGVTAIERAVILGAGGTAQAALAAVQALGQSEPRVLVRDPRRTGELRAAAERLGVRPHVATLPADGALPAADVIISTWPPGAADVMRVVDARVVLDVVYAPWPTRFAAAAAASGATVVGGLSVLLYQAVAQVELMTGRTAPVAAMRVALTAAVTARAGCRAPAP